LRLDDLVQLGVGHLLECGKVVLDILGCLSLQKLSSLEAGLVEAVDSIEA